MDLILCHTTADFDTLGAAVGMTYLLPGARIVLPGGEHPGVRAFLALHRDRYPLIERRAVNPQEIRSLTLVDAQMRSRFGPTAEWLDLPQLETLRIYDHHRETPCDIEALAHQTWEHQCEAVGATTTLIVEKLQAQTPQTSSELDPFTATVMALGIHADTGSLTYDLATPRDAKALAWLMEQGANIDLLRDYLEPGFSPTVQALLSQALQNVQQETLEGQSIGWVLLETETYAGGLAALTSELMGILGCGALLLGVHWPVKGTQGTKREQGTKGAQGTDNLDERLTVIGRSQIQGTHLGNLFKPWGGGGHAKAGSVALRSANPGRTFEQIKTALFQQLPAPLTAQDLMSSPVRTIRPETTVEAAQRLLLRYGHSGLCIANEQDRLVGIISRRDLDLALHHGLGHAPVKGYMSQNLKTIAPTATLPEIEQLMVTYDVGRLPVLRQDKLLGIVTRTDVLRIHYRDWAKNQIENGAEKAGTQLPVKDSSSEGCSSEENPTTDAMKVVLSASSGLPVKEMLSERLLPQLWELLERAAQFAETQGWHLYLVGGGVRDLLLADPSEPLLLSDVDLVVDGFHASLTEAAGVELAQTLQQDYPQARLEIHGKFQTAALLWHNDPVFESMWVDVATSRTEFYPYPAANPEVEASSIRQDLYRRDFTINALAVQLTEPRSGELLDFFGGVLDLRDRQVRVLHANSFIEDPTRIFRAVRFAVRLGFTLEPQTRSYITYAINSGIYERTQGENPVTPALQTRLRSELKYILEAPYWQPALKLLSELDALRCLHAELQLTPDLDHRIRLINRGLRRLELKIDPWRLRLELLLTGLQPDQRTAVASKLQLPQDSIQRLERLAIAQQTLPESLAKSQSPSQLYTLLQPYPPILLTLLAAQSDRQQRRKIWRYLTRWQKIKPLINGNDLKSLGYKPGKPFKIILHQLLMAQLDGLIKTKSAAQQQLQQQFPLDQSVRNSQQSTGNQ